jgi:DNA-binding IclR family transcriptional regulator
MNPLDKALQVLEAMVSPQGVGALFSDAKAQTSLARPSTQQNLKNLTDLGYLTHGHEGRRYRGSMRLAGLAPRKQGRLNAAPR